MKITLNWRELEEGEAVEVSAETPVLIGREIGCSVVLSGDRISRRHANITLEGEQVFLTDQGSTNGTLLNGAPVQRSALVSGDRIQIGDFEITVLFQFEIPQSADANKEIEAHPTVIDPEIDRLPDELKGTLIFQDGDSDLTPFISDVQPVSDKGFPPPAFDEEFVRVAALRSSGVTVDETTYLALGSGIGSFVWVDHLLIFGADPRQVASIGLDSSPYARYARLCEQSQIPLHERLRSNSDSCPDNIWGWPGYAVREIWGSLKAFELSDAFKVAWTIFNEPVLGAVYTPRAGDVFASIDREVDRIGWDQIFRYGRIKAIRKTDDGRYAVAYSQSSQETGQVNKIMLARYLHLAMGYPGVRFLKDLQDYRERERDFSRVVNAYEEHEQVYADLKENGGTVLIRGRGIVASRIIQRLNELRTKRQNIQILHLMRSPSSEGARYHRARRVVDNHWEFQPYNWPKAAWGGDLRELLEKSSPEERDQLYDEWGGTTTASRKDWKKIIEKGLSEGWYQIRFGSVKSVIRNEDDKLVTTIEARGAISGETHMIANYIVDCTGLEADISASPVLHDLVSHYHLDLNPKGRLAIENDFKLRGMDNGRGRMYASGAMTLGGPYAPVDSFLGLQYAAQRAVYALADSNAPGLRALNGFSSLAQWVRWAQGRQP